MVSRLCRPTTCGSTGQWTMAKQEPEKDKDKPVSVRKPFNGIRLQANADNTGFVDYSECEDYEAQVDPCYQVVANRDPSRTMVQPLIGINRNGRFFDDVNSIPEVLNLSSVVGIGDSFRYRCTTKEFEDFLGVNDGYKIT